MAAFQGTPAAGARQQAELRSRCTLVCWAALCSLHAAAVRAHPLLLQYSVGVDWKQLRHLVLSDRAAEDALQGVAAYVRRHTRPGKAVFTLADGGSASFDMARRYVQQDSALRALWRKEQVAAEQRKAAHWAAVQTKKQRVAQLRKQLAQQQRQVAAAEKEERRTDIEKDRCSLTRYRCPVEWRLVSQAWSDACNALGAAASAVCSTEASIMKTLEPPAPLIQRLPQQEAAAAPWLFFAHMPPLFRCVLLVPLLLLLLLLHIS
mgnify:CR=1 FL=1